MLSLNLGRAAWSKQQERNLLYREPSTEVAAGSPVADSHGKISLKKSGHPLRQKGPRKHYEKLWLTFGKRFIEGTLTSDSKLAAETFVQVPRSLAFQGTSSLETQRRFIIIPLSVVKTTVKRVLDAIFIKTCFTPPLHPPQKYIHKFNCLHSQPKASRLAS